MTLKLYVLEYHWKHYALFTSSQQAMFHLRGAMFCLGKVWLVIKPIGLESLRLLSSLPILAGPPGTFYEKRPFLQL